jgi:hypothetical protein
VRSRPWAVNPLSWYFRHIHILQLLYPVSIFLHYPQTTIPICYYHPLLFYLYYFIHFTVLLNNKLIQFTRCQCHLVLADSLVHYVIASQKVAELNYMLLTGSN